MRKTTAARNADALAEKKERIKALTDKLESGVKEVFESEAYKDYLKTMSKFHRYSFGNCMLIFFQCPGATAVAGYTTWRKLGRTVKKGEHGIQILAPCPFKTMVEQNKMDNQGNFVLGADGLPEKVSTLVSLTRFKIAYVFDVSQTEGKELPSLGVDELTGDVEGFDEIFSAVEALSPVPIHFREPEESKGCYNQLEQCIYVNKGMSQVQTMKTLIHETAHAKLHALPVSAGIIMGTPVKDRRTREVEAESIAYVVCQHFGMFVLYLAVLAAGVYEDGMNLFQFMAVFPDAMNHPFDIRLTRHTVKFMLGALTIYGGAVAVFYSGSINRRPGEEHGSAKWGNVRELDKKYRDKDPSRNVILTKHLCMSLNGRKHMRNLLQIVVGGSGAGKTRFVVKPNLLLANASFIATDPKGELVRAVAPLLLQQGYVVKVFDLIEPSHSDSYNPFRYIRKDSDVFKLINNFIQNTTPKGSKSNDPFWEKSEVALDSALMLYLLHESPPYEQTMEMMLTMIEYAGAKEDDDDFQSALDLLFEALEEEQPDHIAVRQYHIFKQAAGKTAKSILVSAAVRLASFTLPEIQDITDEDSLELSKLGDRKQAIFCVIPDSNDVSLNFLVGMLYTQAFQELYYQADKVHMGGLPVPVRLMFDEFANVALPDGYARLQATMRSRNIMATIILQNISQLKALFKDDWEGIIGNADTMIYLGGNEQSTHQYISEQLGKETIITTSRSQGKGKNGSFSQSTQQTGRELMTPDEVRLLDNKNAIVFIRGERPVIDEKYDLMKHPNVIYTEDGGAKPYVHSPHCLYDMRYLLSTLEENE